jgi:shikimate kinase
MALGRAIAMAEALRLVLISGPVASGKTTLAWRVAALARAAEGAAASIDMDELTEMTGGSDWTQVLPQHRRQACELAAVLIDRMSAQGARVVVVAGSTLSPYEWDAVIERVSVPVLPVLVRLRVSIAAAIRRAEADQTRVLTRDPEVVRRLHRAIDWDVAAAPDIEIDTDEMTADEVAEAVMSLLRNADR